MGGAGSRSARAVEAGTCTAELRAQTAAGGRFRLHALGGKLQKKNTDTTFITVRSTETPRILCKLRDAPLQNTRQGTPGAGPRCARRRARCGRSRSLRAASASPSQPRAQLMDLGVIELKQRKNVFLTVFTS